MESLAHSKTKFIKARLFDKKLEVVKYDKYAYDYLAQLSKFYRQFQAIGNNYNQAVRVVNSGLINNQAVMDKLSVLIISNKQLVSVMRDILAMTADFRKYLETK